jgi:hypothetical protein
MCIFTVLTKSCQPLLEHKTNNMLNALIPNALLLNILAPEVTYFSFKNECWPNLRVGDPTIRADPDEPVWDGDLVQVALLPVDYERVRYPDLGHEGPVQSQFSDTCIKRIT